ncbi:MAG: rod shape-determining protein RodA [Acidobacteria bacterium]|nr:rod shape-determining protein RodA [Acidobacteriota bacterium]
MIINRRYFSEFDWISFLIAISLSLIGIAFIYSATRDASRTLFLWRQLIWLACSLILFAMVMLIDYHTLTDHVHFLYGFGLIFLLGVLVFGSEVRGHRSWLRIGTIALQPSEFVKIVTILALVRFLSRGNKEHLSGSEIALAAGITSVPMLLVMLEGDLGSAMTFLPVLGCMTLVCGLKRKFVVISVVAALSVAPVAWFSLKNYQRQRIVTTFNSELDPKGVGYQAQQSKIAIGSGGVLGKGIFQGTQSQLGFLPARHTDFIFAVLTEEAGLAGALAVLGLYFWLLQRVVGFTRAARDRSGMLLVVGVASLLAFHLLINVGMVLGLIPIMGIPLPLLSYGGSSLMSTFLGLGLILNVQARRFFY